MNDNNDKNNVVIDDDSSVEIDYENVGMIINYFLLTLLTLTLTLIVIS